MKVTVIIAVVVIFMCFSAGIFSLLAIQLTNSGGERAAVYTDKMPAVRGSITDSAGAVIAGNRESYDVILDAAYFPKRNADINAVLLEVIHFLEENDCTYRRAFSHAEGILPELIAQYEISLELDRDLIVSLAAVRYEMDLEEFSLRNPFIISEDVPSAVAAAFMERSVMLPGVGVVKNAVRYIENGAVLPHLIGTVGPVYAEEYASAKERGYSADSLLGKSGIEKAAEDFLRGEAGVRKIILENGIAAADFTAAEPRAGANVALTAESGFQLEVQRMLEDYLKEINKTCGALVVLDCKTGAVLALATAPTYDLRDYMNDYPTVAAGKDSPLLNRALFGLYRPGSSFKTVTAAAGLSEGVVNGESTLNCAHRYNCLGTEMGCLGNHSNIRCANALGVSCNIYFYRLALMLGEGRLESYARGLGFGTDNEFDAGTTKGYLATPETLASFGIRWTDGQLAQAGIGQSEIGATPLQMAVCAMTIANNGERLRPHIIESVTDSSGEQVYKAEKKLLGKIGTAQAYAIIKDGMVRAARNNRISAAAVKTGTPQSGRGTDSVVIGFAPREAPEIAFSIVLEGGENAKNMVNGLLEACKEKGYM